MRHDLDNWIKYPAMAILPKRGQKPRDLSQIYRSGLLLVCWYWSQKAPTVGELEPIIKSPLGRLIAPAREFGILSDKDYVSFWQIPNDGQPYRLQARILNDLPHSTQLRVWEYSPQNMATVNNPPTAAPIIDLSPLVGAIQAADQNATAHSAAIQGQLGQLVTASAQASNNKFDERVIKEFTGNSLDGFILDPDNARRTVIITLPAIDVNGNPQPKPVYIAIGDAPRSQIDDYNYTLLPGGSVTIEDSEAIQRISAWLEQGAAPQIVNLTWTFI
jgi:hypothetical protein